MLYEEARVYLDSVSKYGSVLGLDSIKNLLEELENPQKELTFIHIAGTNGKGSILAYLSTILTEAGYRTGRYISPTVIGYLERFQIDGTFMEEEELARLTCHVKAAVERLVEKGQPYPTVFEIETAIAFLYFKESRCDFVVLESGLGGLMDATNVIENPKLCVFASVSMDHIGVLGNTLEEIARDKAGIIKSGSEVVTGRQQPCVKEVLEETARAKGCRITIAEPEKIQVLEQSLEVQKFSYGEFETMEIHLAGQHQIENAVTVLEAVRALRRQGVRIEEEAVRKGLERTKWPGRLMVLGRHPLVIADGAHNEDAVRRLAENLDIYLKGKKVTAVLGVFKDKEYEKMIGIMTPYLDYVYAIDLPNRDRTLAKEELCEVLAKYGICAEPAVHIEQALVQAKKRAGKDGVVLAFGSLSYLGEVIRLEERAERK